MKQFISIIQRDLWSGWRKKNQIYQPLVFQLLVVTMFPLGLGAGAQQLQNIAPAVIWILTVLSMLLTLEDIFKSDYSDGTLEIYTLCSIDLPLVVLAKSLSHWMLSCLPIIVFAPIIAILLHLPSHAFGAMLLSLLLGTPALSLFGALGSAVVMRQSNGGLLLCLLIMPLLTPILIFGAGAILESTLGNNHTPQLLLLSAASLFAIVLLPFATAAVIKTNLE